MHASDCSIHNEPAFPKGKCDCWWLVSGEDITKIHDEITRIYNALIIQRGQAAEILHMIDSGLHMTATKEVPEDFKEKRL